MEKEIKSYFLGPPKEEGQLRNFCRETSKRENSEKIRKGLATNVDDTASILVPRVANTGNQWYIRNPRMTL